MAPKTSVDKATLRGTGDCGPLDVGDDVGLALRAALSHLSLAVQNVVQQIDGGNLDEEVSAAFHQHAATLVACAEHDASSRPSVRSRFAQVKAGPCTAVPEPTQSPPALDSDQISSDDVRFELLQASSAQEDSAIDHKPPKVGKSFTLADTEVRKMALRSIYMELQIRHRKVDYHELCEALAQEGVAQSVVASLSDGFVSEAEWYHAVDTLQPTDKALTDMPEGLCSQRADSFLNTISPGLRLPRFMLHHRSMRRCIWDVLMTLLLLYLALVLPFRYAFLQDKDTNDPLEEVDRYLDWIFILDIFLNFRTTFSTDDGVDVVRPCLVARHYLRTWFVIDLVSSVPYDQIADNLPGLQPLRLLKVGKITRVFKVLRVTRALRIGSAFQSSLEMLAMSVFFRATVSMAIVFLWTFVFCHWVACFMVVSGDGYLEGKVGDHPAERYLAAFYWSLTTVTTVGYGDMVPTNSWERAYAIVAMVVGCGCYGFILGNISFVVHTKNANEKAFTDRMGVVQAWLSYHALPRETSGRILHHFRLLLKEKAVVDEVAIMNDLSPALAEEVSEALIPKEIRNAALFQGLQPLVLSQIAKVTRQHEVEAGTKLVTKGSQGVGMFFIRQGQVRLDMAVGAPRIVSALEAWGEEVLLGLATNYDYSARCTTPVTLLFLPLDMFNQTFAHFRDALHSMRVQYNRMEHAEVPAPQERQKGRSSIFAAPDVMPPHFVDTVLDYFDDITEKLKWLEFEVARLR